MLFSRCYFNGKRFPHVLRKLSSKSLEYISFTGGITINEAYNQACELFKQCSVVDSEESARYLISFVANLGYRHSDFTRSLTRNLTAQEMQRYNQCIEERLKAKPIQYIIGDWDFYGMTFQCRPNVLIPRPETEELVENIINELRSVRSNVKTYRILDIGSGSGCIGICLSSAFSHSEVVAIDPNPIAVSLSEDNAKKNIPNNRYKCINVDFKTFLKEFEIYRNYFDIIVSNPPYIPSRLIESLQAEVRDYEDRGALDGGDDGLEIAWSIINQSKQLLKVDGPRLLWLELSREHPKMIEKQLTPQTDIYESVISVNDLSQYPRFLRIQYK